MMQMEVGPTQFMYCMGVYVLYGIHSMDEREGRQASSACSAMQ